MRRANRRKVLARATDNCGACGEEVSSVELSSVKIATWTVKVCSDCSKKDPADDYREAADILKKK